MKSYQTLVETRLEPVGKTGKDIIYICPECGDTSGHLYINYDKNYWHCFRCGIGGKRIESLLRLLHINVEYDYEKLYSERDKDLDNILSIKNTKVKSDSVVEYSTDLEILTEYYLNHIKPLSVEAYNYLLDRGVSDYQIDRLCIREGIDRYGMKITSKGREFDGRDYSGRIMVPSLRRDGLISFYVARDYVGGKAAKYLNPPKEIVAASEDVWNLDMINSDSVIICEGVFTAIAASPAKLNAVATYGKSIAEFSSNDSGIRVTSQGEKLLNRKFKNYYVAYDADARFEAVKTCQYLYDRGANVYLVVIDPSVYGAKADVADIGIGEFIKLMKSAIHYTGGLSNLL